MTPSFSFVTRAANLAAMAERPLDLLIIGGGITGAAIAREAAGRGIRSALVERVDFAAGASGRASRTTGPPPTETHGFGLRDALRATGERRALLSQAPHLVRPHAILLPLFAGGPVRAWKLAVRLGLHDALAAFRNVGRHQWLSKRAVASAEPGLRAQGLQVGLRYWDAACDPARLTLAIVRDAVRLGCLVSNHAEAVHLDLAEGRVRGARIVDGVAGTPYQVHARLVVSATGAWSDALRDDGHRQVRVARAAYITVPASRLGATGATVIRSPIDGRELLAIPDGTVTAIGAVPNDQDLPADEIRATGDDVIYLLRSANAAFPDARLQTADVIASWAAPLASGPAPKRRDAQSLEHAGLLTVVGGAFAAHGRTAAIAVDRVARLLHESDGRVPAAPRHRAEEPLPGGEVADPDLLARDAEREGMRPCTARYLVRCHGSETPAVVRLARTDEQLAQPIAAGHPAIRAQLIHALDREMGVSLTDLLMRRTRVFYEVPGNGMREAAGLVDLVAAQAGWNASRKARELAEFLAEVERHNLFRSEDAN